MCNATEPKLVFEIETCGRCGGSGRYSYCQTMSGPHGPYTCFGCRGTGRKYTKRGAAAYDLLERAYSKPAGQLVPGDMIKEDGKWETVTRAYQQTENDNTGFSTSLDGVRHYWFTVETMRGQMPVLHHTYPEKLVRVAQTAERKAFILPLVAEYQSLLNKTGKPSKKAEARIGEIFAALGLVK